MNIEKNDSYYFQIDDLCVHKKLVLDSGLILVRYLLNEENNQDLAFKLLKRISEHDNSKLNEDEFEMLCRIPYNTKTFTNADLELSDIIKDSVELHWKHNRHHPEFFENIQDMTELDIMEMCCDWHARSKQYETDFLSFVKTRQENRFHFPQEMFDRIWKYCLILDEEE